MPEEIQPQDVVAQEPVGVETPQPAEVVETKPLGAEVKERTYTQKEWSKRESAKDKEIAEIKKQIAQISQQSQVERIQQVEMQARANDQREVEGGIITPQDASLRAQNRYHKVQSDLTLAQQQETLVQMSSQTEQYGRVLAAQDFGKEYELGQDEIAELLSDTDLKTPSDMKAKAATLAWEKTQTELKKSRGAPKYDQGLQGGDTATKTLKSRYPTMFKK